jgi:hypothetical protein
MGQFLTEAVHALRANTTFDECAGVHTWAGVTLEEDLIAAAWVILTAEEVVEANFVKRSRRRVRRNVTADADARTLSAVNHDGCVPAHECADAALVLSIAGKLWLISWRDGVDVVRAADNWNADRAARCMSQHLEHDLASALHTMLVDEGVERLSPFASLVWVNIDVLTGDAG